MSRISIIAAVALAVVVSGAASLLAFAQEDGGSEPSRPLGTPALAAFGAARGVDDALPGAAARALRGVPGLEAAETVRTLSTAGWDMYLTPAEGAACLSVVDEAGGASVACFDREALTAGRTSPAGAMLTGCHAPSPAARPICESVVLYGVVPDGVDQVAIDAEAGASTVVVENNTYLVEASLSSQPTAVRYNGASGTIVQTLPIP